MGKDDTKTINYQKKLDELDEIIDLDQIRLVDKRYERLIEKRKKQIQEDMNPWADIKYGLR